LIARDHMGITPLYIGWGKDGSIFVSSEMKSLIGECTKVCGRCVDLVLIHSIYSSLSLTTLCF
jgi:asparagine synthetase B (glutamine-hydrolysing)